MPTRAAVALFPTALSTPAASLPPTLTREATPTVEATRPAPDPTVTPTGPPATAGAPPLPPGAEPFPSPPAVFWPSPTPHPFPIAVAPRQGVGASLGSGDEGAFGSWSYFWHAYVPPTPGSTQHVPMLAGGPTYGLPERAIIEEMAGRATHDYWLVFNECDHPLQCNAPPEQAADFYHDQVISTLFDQGADPDARLILGGTTAHPCGIRWLEAFVNYYEATYGPVPRAGWHFHVYPELGPAAWPAGCEGGWAYQDAPFESPEVAFSVWKEQAAGVLAFLQKHGRATDEVWFTEMGCLNYGYHQIQAPACQADGFVQAYAADILAWLNDEGRWVDRYAWFTNWDDDYWEVTHLLSSAGDVWQYSSLGWFYAQVTPAAAVPWSSR